MWHSQAGQDAWVVGMLGTEPGVFVDCGAHDGVSTSNTLALERDYWWRGLAIEPEPGPYAGLVANRRCVTTQMAVADVPGVVRIEPAGVTAPAQPLAWLIEQCLPGVEWIDYLSIDVEGAELAVIDGMDFERWPVKLITIEHNSYRDGPGLKDAIFARLTALGFKRAVEDVGCVEPCPAPAWVGCPFEDWYINPVALGALAR